MAALETILALAKEQGISPDSFKKWRSRGAVPHRYRIDLLAAAAKKGETLTPDDFKFRPGGKKRRRSSQRAAA